MILKSSFAVLAIVASSHIMRADTAPRFEREANALSVRAEKAVSLPAHTKAYGEQADIDVVFDGENYLAVWRDRRTGQDEIRAARVTRAGTLIDPAGIVLHSAAFETISPPAIAFNGDALLVAWNENELLNDSAGALRFLIVDDDLTIAAPVSDVSHRVLRPHLRPVIASANEIFVAVFLRNAPVWNTPTQFGALISPAAGKIGEREIGVGFDVVSIAWNGSVFGAFGLRSVTNVDHYETAGALIDQSLRVQKLFRGDVGTRDTDLDAVWTGETYAVIWSNPQYEFNSTPSSSMINLRKFAPDGSKLGDLATLSSGGVALHPAITSVAGHIRAVWDEREVGASAADIIEAREIAGAFVLKEFGSDSHDERPALTCDAGEDCFVGWTSRPAVGRRSGDVRGAITTTEAARQISHNGIEALTFSGAQQIEASIATELSGVFHAVAFAQSLDDETHEIRFVSLGAGGSAAGAPAIVSATAFDARDPEVACVDAVCLVAWREEVGHRTYRIYARLISAFGVPLDEPKLLNESSDGEFEVRLGSPGPTVAASDEEFLVVWSALNSSAAARLLMTSLAPVAGSAFSTPVPIVVETSSNQHSPSAASDGQSFMIAWDDGDIHCRLSPCPLPEDEIHVARVTNGRSPASTRLILRGTPVGGAELPSAAWGEDRYLVAWKQTYGGDTRILATTVSQQLDAAELEQIAEPAAHDDPLDIANTADGAAITFLSGSAPWTDYADVLLITLDAAMNPSSSIVAAPSNVLPRRPVLSDLIHNVNVLLYDRPDATNGGARAIFARPLNQPVIRTRSARR